MGLTSIFSIISWTVLLGFVIKALHTLHDAITLNVLLFLLGIIILYITSKYFNHKKQVVQQLPTNVTNLPVEYQEYLKYKQLDEQYNTDEKFSFGKLFGGFSQSRTWAKSFVVGIMVTVMLVVGFSVYKEMSNIFGHKTPPVASTITNTGDGKVESKTESKSETKSSNGLNLNIFSSWF